MYEIHFDLTPISYLINIMNILYVSTLVSSKYFDELLYEGYKPELSIQKFNTLLVNGLVDNECNVEALSDIPINNLSKSNKRGFNEEEGKINYQYCPKVNLKVLSNLVVFLSSFIATVRWSNRHKQEEKVVILDILKTSLCLGSLLACSLLRIKTVGIVTDVPGFRMLKKEKKTAKQKLSEFTIKKYISYFDLYVLLTEQMNEIVNPYGRPFIIMEGLVDINMNHNPVNSNKNDKKVILYAGGLFEQYGIKRTIDAFKKLKGDNFELHLYGSGDMTKYMTKYQEEDNRVKFFGVVNNKKVVEAELDATLLINPRPTDEDFTKYSFPSKNMEYMVSGTPLLTTSLPGMPKEYYDYVYLLRDETVDGIYKMFNHLLIEISDDEIQQRGINAKQFVLENKNNIFQAKRIVNFIQVNL